MHSNLNGALTFPAILLDHSIVVARGIPKFKARVPSHPKQGCPTTPTPFQIQLPNTLREIQLKKSATVSQIQNDSFFPNSIPVVGG